MATKKAKFNLSQAVRDAIAKNSKGTGKEIVELVKAANPGQKINESTAIVTWSKLRGKGKRRKSKRVRKPTAARKTKATTTSGAGAHGIVATIHAAKALIQAAGGTEQAKRLIYEL
jgi:hypothetical protein